MKATSLRWAAKLWKRREGILLVSTPTSAIYSFTTAQRQFIFHLCTADSKRVYRFVACHWDQISAPLLFVQYWLSLSTSNTFSCASSKTLHGFLLYSVHAPLGFDYALRAFLLTTSRHRVVCSMLLVSAPSTPADSSNILLGTQGTAIPLHRM